MGLPLHFLRLTMRRDRIRLLIGLVAAVALPWGGAAGPPRLWLATAVTPLFAWMMLGRDARLVKDGLRDSLRGAPMAWQLVVSGWIFPLLIMGVWSGFAAGALIPALVLFTWSAAVVLVADALDRHLGRSGAAWGALWLLVVLIWTMPLWMAGWFGSTEWAPWPATLSVALHPAGSALTAAGFSALQDPWFYRFTLSGVVEARPAPWVWGVLFYGGIASLAAIAALKGARVRRLTYKI